jgi:hypothetical protein
MNVPVAVRKYLRTLSNLCEGVITSGEVRHFGAGQHQWHWLEEKFLKYIPLKILLAKVLALGSTSGTGWKKNF